MKRKYEDTETLRKANMDLLDIKVSIRISLIYIVIHFSSQG